MKVKKYDQWLIVSAILLVLFLVFLVWPLFGLLKQSVFNSAGEFSLANFERFFTYVLFASGHSHRLFLFVL